MAHTLIKELAVKQYEAAQKVEIGGIYYHYRNPKLHYKVISIGIQEETEKAAVFYEALYGQEQIRWIRDLDKWLEIVEHEGKKVHRFQKVA